MSKGDREVSFSLKKMRIENNVMIKMRDGVRLATDIFFPDREGIYPAIAVRTPYTKSRWRKQHLDGDEYMNPRKFTDAGYIVAVQDCRGTGNSEGSYVPWRDDACDGYDFIEWLAVQSWCTGKIGAMGSSNLGSVQLLEASMTPPHLATICPCGTSAHMPFFRHGIMNLAGASIWYLQQAERAAANPNLTDSRREELERIIAEVKSDMNRQYSWLPLKDMQLAHMEETGIEPYFNEWLSHVSDSGYWTRMHMPAEVRNIQIPILFIAHWYDHLARDTFEAYHEVVHFGTKTAQENVHLYIGPWRKYVGIEGGESDHWNEGRRLTDILIEWFDHWLYGKENGIGQKPPVLYYVLGKKEWRYANAWPVPETRELKLYFASDAGANSVYGDGRLSEKAATGKREWDTYDYDPLDPVPCRSGVVISPGDSLIQSQEEVEQRQDVLVFSTEALPEDVEIVGPAEVVLWASSSARDTDFTAKLVHVLPDGSTYNVAEGIVRARFRNGIDREEFLLPDAVYPYYIDLSGVGMLFPRGHKIRVEISSSNFPKHDRNMNTGNAVGVDAEGIVAHQKIYHDRRHPSFIRLHVVSSKQTADTER